MADAFSADIAEMRGGALQAFFGIKARGLSHLGQPASFYAAKGIK